MILQTRNRGSKEFFIFIFKCMYSCITVVNDNSKTENNLVSSSQVPALSLDLVGRFMFLCVSLVQ